MATCDVTLRTPTERRVHKEIERLLDDRVKALASVVTLSRARETTLAMAFAQKSSALFRLAEKYREHIEMAEARAEVATARLTALIPLAGPKSARWDLLAI